MNRSRLRLASLVVAALVLVVSATASADPGVPGAPDTSAQSVISATGTGQVSFPAVALPTMLNIGVHQQVNGDPDVAVKATQATTEAIQDALGQKLGISKSAFQVMNFNMYPQYGPPEGPQSKGAPPVPPVVTGYSIDQNMQVEVSSVDQLAKAMQTAISAGATSVNTYSKGGPDQLLPDPATLAPAVAQATEQAKALAQASADAAGVKLGQIRSIVIQPPFPWYSGGPGPTAWRVNVTVTYDVVQ